MFVDFQLFFCDTISFHSGKFPPIPVEASNKASHTKWPGYLRWTHLLVFTPHTCVPRSCPLQAWAGLFWPCFRGQETGGLGERSWGMGSFPSSYGLWVGTGSSLCSGDCFLSSPFRPSGVNDLPLLQPSTHCIILCWFLLILGYLCKLCFYFFNPLFWVSLLWPWLLYYHSTSQTTLRMQVLYVYTDCSVFMRLRLGREVAHTLK